MTPSPRNVSIKHRPQMSDYALNRRIQSIQTTAKQSAETAQQIEERMVGQANGRWEDQESIEEN